MNKPAIAISISLLALGMATAASAHARCDGDFQYVRGNWIATPYCQELAADRIVHREHLRLSQHASRYTETPDEYCRWHGANIETSTFCSEYND
jgi:hypothetical protein